MGKTLATKGYAKPANKKYGLKPTLNKEFKVKHTLQYSGAKRKPWGIHLRDVEQPAFEEIVSLSQKAALQLLVRHGVVPKANSQLLFTCWKCSSSIACVSKEYRCYSCEHRCRITQPSCAFTPVWFQAAGGARIDWQTFVRACWTTGNLIQNDAAAHMVRRKGTTWKAATHQLERLLPCIKLALAWKEACIAAKTTFHQDIVEPDSMRLGASCSYDQKNKRTINKGRCFALEGRTTRRWLLKGLADRICRKGCGPESKVEVSSTIAEKVKASCLLAPDGAPAFRAAAKSAGLQVLGGVSHSRKVFTPTSRLSRRDLSARGTRWVVRKGCAKKTTVYRSYKKHVAAAGGDQLAENLLGHVKRTARRMGTMGGGTSKPHMKSLQALAAAALLREAGFMSVLVALRKYREDCTSGAVLRSPRDAWSVEKATWLTGESP